MQELTTDTCDNCVSSGQAYLSPVIPQARGDDVYALQVVDGCEVVAGRQLRRPGHDLLHACAHGRARRQLVDNTFQPRQTVLHHPPCPPKPSQINHPSVLQGMRPVNGAGSVQTCDADREDDGVCLVH